MKKLKKQNGLNDHMDYVTQGEIVGVTPKRGSRGGSNHPPDELRVTLQRGKDGNNKVVFYPGSQLVEEIKQNAPETPVYVTGELRAHKDRLAMILRLVRRTDPQGRKARFSPKGEWKPPFIILPLTREIENGDTGPQAVEYQWAGNDLVIQLPSDFVLKAEQV
jgi:hypothetical protein